VGVRVINPRCLAATAIPIQPSANRVQIRDLYAEDCSGASVVKFAGGVMSGVYGALFWDNSCTGPLIDAGVSSYPVFESIACVEPGAGLLKVPAIQASIRGVVSFGNLTGIGIELLTTTLPMAEISDVYWEGSGTILDYTGAAAPKMFHVSNLVFATGTLKGMQNTLWENVSALLSGTFNFNSKTGQQIANSDLTVATISNIPSDLVSKLVKGLADYPRPHITSKASGNQDLTGSYADISDLQPTLIVPQGSDVEIIWEMEILETAGSACELAFKVLQDGADALFWGEEDFGANDARVIVVTYLATNLASGSHTWKLQAKEASGSGNLRVVGNFLGVIRCWAYAKLL
jgi:hypothetical protein